MQLTELKKEMQFNEDLLGLIDTLKNVAASQYHMLEKQRERFDLFLDSFSHMFRVVNLTDVEDPFVSEMTDTLGIVIVTSDSGFMGGLNQGVLRKAWEAQGDLPDSQVSLIVIGDKGTMTVSDMGRDFKGFSGIGQETIYEQAVEIKNYIVQEVLEKRIGKVVIAYPKALSFSSQEVSYINLLPCAELFDKDAQSELSEHLDEKAEGFVGEARNLIVESSLTDLVEYLAGTWVTAKLFEVFEDSKLAEFSARAMHLEGSVQKIEVTYKKSRRKVFKAVHEHIDKQMRESHSAKTLMEKKKLKIKRLRAQTAQDAATARSKSS